MLHHVGSVLQALKAFLSCSKVEGLTSPLSTAIPWSSEQTCKFSARFDGCNRILAAFWHGRELESDTPMRKSNHPGWPPLRKKLLRAGKHVCSNGQMAQTAHVCPFQKSPSECCGTRRADWRLIHVTKARFAIQNAPSLLKSIETHRKDIEIILEPAQMNFESVLARRCLRTDFWAHPIGQIADAQIFLRIEGFGLSVYHREAVTFGLSFAQAKFN